MSRKKLTPPPRTERILPRLIDDEMRESFLKYSMSVIVQRALPDVRDGLKPVHRRILYAMYELGLRPERPYKKSATVVGDVLGKYHPHGDVAVYDAMVRMVQTFSLRYPLIDGQGNFGSIDGDNAAAYRYTEVRLAAPAMEVLADIDQDTVDFSPNFDDQSKEPTVLPSRIPNLLLNGSTGIAVGMSTNIPPHNLNELCKTMLWLIDHPEATDEQVAKKLPGPDFPTGGIIIGKQGIRDMYMTGRGKMIVRAKIEREKSRKGNDRLVVTELPYGVNKSRVIEQIADLSRDDKIPDLADLRDESDRDGIRVVIELKKDGSVARVLERLYKLTPLQQTFGAIVLALHNNTPREFSLRAMLSAWLEHRVDVIVRRTRFLLEKAKGEAHILEGLLIAIDSLDEAIAIIRRADDRVAAAKALRKRFSLSELQADAILAMRLARLTKLESGKLRELLAIAKKTIAACEATLASRDRQLKMIRTEIEQLESVFGDARRTQIVDGVVEEAIEDEVVPDREVIVLRSRNGYAGWIDEATFEKRVGLRRVTFGDTRAPDVVVEQLSANLTDTILFFDSKGQAHALPVSELPELARSQRGRALSPLLSLDDTTRLVGSVVVTSEDDEHEVVLITELGIVKRTPLLQFLGGGASRGGGVNAMTLKEGDSLVHAGLAVNDDVIMVTRKGRALRLAMEEVPSLGRPAQGVIGMRLGKGDLVAAALSNVDESDVVAIVTDGGWAKRVRVEDLPAAARGGHGSTILSTSHASGPVLALVCVGNGDAIVLGDAVGRLTAFRANDAPRQARSSSGRQLATFAVASVHVSPIGDD